MSKKWILSAKYSQKHAYEHYRNFAVLLKCNQSFGCYPCITLFILINLQNVHVNLAILTQASAQNVTAVHMSTFTCLTEESYKKWDASYMCKALSQPQCKKQINSIIWQPKEGFQNRTDSAYKVSTQGFFLAVGIKRRWDYCFKKDRVCERQKKSSSCFKAVFNDGAVETCSYTHSWLRSGMWQRSSSPRCQVGAAASPPSPAPRGTERGAHCCAPSAAAQGASSTRRTMAWLAAEGSGSLAQKQ